MNLKEWIDSFTDKYKSYSLEALLSLDNIYIQDMGITELPRDLLASYTKGRMILNSNPIKRIPDNFKQGGYLDLSHCGIEEIGNGFIQKDELLLHSNNIKAIPDDFIQNGILSLGWNCIEKIPESFVQKGDLELNNNLITRIPENFVVNGHLNLNNNEIKEISRGFRQNGNHITLKGNPIEFFDEDVKLDVATACKLMKRNMYLFAARKKREEFYRACK